MPYIKFEKRQLLLPSIQSVCSSLCKQKHKKGDLNYTISMIIKHHIDCKGISYDTLSDITGVLNDVKTEFERQVVAPYEDKKIEENGNVYNITLPLFNIPEGYDYIIEEGKKAYRKVAPSDTHFLTEDYTVRSNEAGDFSLRKYFILKKIKPKKET